MGRISPFFLPSRTIAVRKAKKNAEFSIFPVHFLGLSTIVGVGNPPGGILQRGVVIVSTKHPSACEHCGQPLNLAGVASPRLGLVPIDCPHCQHHHLLSPRELAQARQEIPTLRYSPARLEGFWLQLRRFIAS